MLGGLQESMGQVDTIVRVEIMARMAFTFCSDAYFWETGVKRSALHSDILSHPENADSSVEKVAPHSEKPHSNQPQPQSLIQSHILHFIQEENFSSSDIFYSFYCLLS